jgi:hypothetical protein
MWDKIGVALAVALPLSGVILTIALKIISSKERKALPDCIEKFKAIESEMDAMKKGSTDRASIMVAIQAAMDLLKEKTLESERGYKELNHIINQTSTDVAVIKSNIENMVKVVAEIRKNGKYNKKNKA